MFDYFVNNAYHRNKQNAIDKKQTNKPTKTSRKSIQSMFDYTV